MAKDERTKDEFFFLIPEGFQISADGEINIGKRSKSVRVKDSRTVSRYINGVVLMMDLYQGKAKEIQPALAEIMRGDPGWRRNGERFRVQILFKEKSRICLGTTAFFQTGRALYNDCQFIAASETRLPQISLNRCGWSIRAKRLRPIFRRMRNKKR